MDKRDVDYIELPKEDNMLVIGSPYGSQESIRLTVYFDIYTGDRGILTLGIVIPGNVDVRKFTERALQSYIKGHNITKAYRVVKRSEEYK